MTMHANIPGDGGLGSKAIIRRVTIDEMSAIRHIHHSAFRVYAGPFLTAEETAAYLGYIQSPRYTDELMRFELYGAVINDELVGTQLGAQETIKVQAPASRPFLSIRSSHMPVSDIGSSPTSRLAPFNPGFAASQRV